MIDPTRIKMILFDLDGTLVDSAADLAYSIDEMLNHLHLPRQGEENVRRWIGNGVDRLIHRALTTRQDGATEADLFNRAKALFLDFYAKNLDKHSVLYPGVESALQRLRQLGLFMGCVTNKPERFTLPLLEHLGLHRFFDIVVCGDTLPQQKPDPQPLRYACSRLDQAPETALMVGDSENDVAAARAAGFGIVAVTYGYNHGRPIAQTHPDLVVDNLEVLAALWAKPGLS